MVSVVLPAYKNKYLRSAINSILGQTYKDFELIIVNDCSPEGLDEIVNSYQDSRIRYYINEKNIGGRNLVENWNHCISYAQGDFIVLASDDDLYSPLYLEKLVALAEKYPNVDLYHCRVVVIDENGSYIHWGEPVAEYESDIDFVFQRSINRRTQVVPDFMCRTSALRAIGGYVDYPRAWYSDEMTMNLLAKSKGVVASTETLFFWRSSLTNISNQSGDIYPKAVASCQHYDKMIEYLGALLPKDDKDIYLLNELKNRITDSIACQLHYDVIKASCRNSRKVMREKQFKVFFPKKWIAMILLGKLRNFLHI